jgi:hypothetical protein
VGDSAPVYLGSRADLEHLEVNVKVKDNFFLNYDDSVSTLVPSRMRAPEKYRGRQEVGSRAPNAVGRKPLAWRTPPREARVHAKKTRNRCFEVGAALMWYVREVRFERFRYPKWVKREVDEWAAAAAMDGGKCSAVSTKQEGHRGMITQFP